MSLTKFGYAVLIACNGGTLSNGIPLIFLASIDASIFLIFFIIWIKAIVRIFKLIQTNDKVKKAEKYIIIHFMVILTLFGGVLLYFREKISGE
jgi:glucan phosphoethanolaminetransferase (alkaline phosphatase superfamily)